jgi:hypothetical protein
MLIGEVHGERFSNQRRAITSVCYPTPDDMFLGLISYAEG